MSTTISVGQRVQVYNPGPLKTGRVVAPPKYQHGSPVVLIRWDDDNSESHARVDLLRSVGE